MRRHWPSRTEALRLAEFDLRLTIFSSLENRLSHKSLEDGRISCDSGVDNQIRFTNPAVRRERQFRLAVAADQIGHAEKSLPQTDDFQMRSLVFFRAEPLAKRAHDIKKQFIQFKFPGSREFQAAVEPAQFSLAFGVNVVIEIQNPATEIPFLRQQFFERVESLSSLRGDAQDRDVAIYFLDERGQFVGFFGGQLINSIEQNRIGFFELFAKDVSGF